MPDRSNPMPVNVWLVVIIIIIIIIGHSLQRAPPTGDENANSKPRPPTAVDRFQAESQR